MSEDPESRKRFIELLREMGEQFKQIETQMKPPELEEEDEEPEELEIIEGFPNESDIANDYSQAPIDNRFIRLGAPDTKPIYFYRMESNGLYIHLSPENYNKLTPKEKIGYFPVTCAQVRGKYAYDLTTLLYRGVFEDKNPEIILTSEGNYTRNLLWDVLKCHWVQGHEINQLTMHLDDTEPTPYTLSAGWNAVLREKIAERLAEYNPAENWSTFMKNLTDPILLFQDWDMWIHPKLLCQNQDQVLDFCKQFENLPLVGPRDPLAHKCAIAKTWIAEKCKLPSISRIATEHELALLK